MQLLVGIIFCKRRFALIGIFFSIFFFLLLPFAGAEEKAATKDNIGLGAIADGEGSSKKVAPGATDEQKTSLIQLYSWAKILPENLIDLKVDIGKTEDIQNLRGLLPSLATEVEALRWQVTLAKTSSELQLWALDANQGQANQLSRKLVKIGIPVEQAVSDLSTRRKEWLVKKKEISSFADQDFLDIGVAEREYESLLAIIDEAFTLIEGRLTEVLSLGKAIGEIQIVLHGIDADLRELEKERLQVTMQQTTPSMLTGEFYRRLNRNMVDHGLLQFKSFIRQQSLAVQEAPQLILASFIGFLLLSFVLGKSKSITPASSRWYPFAQCKFATSIFLVACLNGIAILINLELQIKDRWTPLLYILLMLSVVRLAGHLVTSKWRRSLLIPLTSFLVVTFSLVLFRVPEIIIYLFVFYVSLFAAVYYLFQLRKLRMLAGLEKWSRLAFGILPTFLVILGVLGYSQFAILLFSTILSTIITTIIIWMMYMLLMGLLDFLLLLAPIDILNENRVAIVSSLRPIVVVFSAVLLVSSQAVIWDIAPTIDDAMAIVFSAGVDLGGLKLSLNFIFVVAVVFYTTTLASRGIQALLLQKVMPRYRVDKGVQLSISRLVHYAILTMGFFAILKILGFQLKQLTLLGGALSVGIGFGLQAIVNNFASGLILLFERPIKVGDTIEIGEELGEVKNMGLRATIIETFDNAEIVIPNSDLVTGQVTNWTLAGRQVRVKIPVGVAYGTDVDKVIEILTQCAKENPMVLSTPKPLALFLAFGESSLDFELRVWIPEFLDKLQALSDLNREIESEFADQGIEIPFPQTDLHLRSVDKEVQDCLTTARINESHG